MVRARIRIKHEDITHDLDGEGYITILCSNIIVSGAKNVTKKPVPNGNDIVEVQTQSVENPKYVISNTKLFNTTYFNYEDIIALIKAKHNGSNPAELEIKYGKPDALSTLPGFDGNSPIKVVLEDFTVPIDATDSEGGYYLIASSLTFSETK